MIDENCINCAFYNEDYPPYHCDFGDHNPVMCTVKMRKMREFRKDKLRRDDDG